MEFRAVSVAGVLIRLTDERWQHVVARHPEMANGRDRVLETVAEPDMIHEGDSGELIATRRYADTPLGSKVVVVAYRETSPDDGFVLTAYLARRPPLRRPLLWTPS